MSRTYRGEDYHSRLYRQLTELEDPPVWKPGQRGDRHQCPRCRPLTFLCGDRVMTTGGHGCWRGDPATWSGTFRRSKLMRRADKRAIERELNL